MQASRYIPALLGADNIARSPADGYNLLFASSSMLSINPHLGTKTSYDILRSFTPIVMIGCAPNVLTVHPAVPAKTVRELTVIARAKPGAGRVPQGRLRKMEHRRGQGRHQEQLKHSS